MWSSPKGHRERATVTKHACKRCRTMKLKCNGRRSQCVRCANGGHVCIYEVAQEGLSRVEDLTLRLRAATRDYERVQPLLRALREENDAVAAGLLARLRLGGDIQHPWRQASAFVLGWTSSFVILSVSF